jgi:hypothetical protein
MKRSHRLSRIVVVVALVVAASVVATASPALAAGGKDDRPEVRVGGSCSGAARAKLKLRSDDGAIELEFEIERAPAGDLWRVALVHERRVAWKGTARATRSNGSLSIDRTIPDLPGYDTVSVRAWGPDGRTCRATATLAGP